MAAHISAIDIGHFAQGRRHANYAELTPDERQAYERIHYELERLAGVAIAVADDASKLHTVLTSGYLTTSGVRGYIPKDLWFAVFNQANTEAYVGMPQLFAIVSTRGVEIGLAAAIHPSDFSASSVKHRVKEAAPQIFNRFPNPGSAEAASLEARLSQSPNRWLFRKKTRLDPGLGEFATLDAWLKFLHSEEGQSWAGASISCYLLPADIQQDPAIVEHVVRDAANVFAPLLLSITPSALRTAPLPEKPDLHVLFERALNEIQIARRHSFGKVAPLWETMEAIKTSLSALPACRTRPQIRIVWSVGAGNWAAVPWIALMDERHTRSTQSGTYVVYLFRSDMSGLYITLNQGVTEIIASHGRTKGREILEQNATGARTKASELAQQGFELDADIDLRSEASLGQDYESSTIAYKFYGTGQIPSADKISTDLEAALSAYERVCLAPSVWANDLGFL